MRKRLQTRRGFLAALAAAGAAGRLASPSAIATPPAEAPLFKISLAEWSLHKSLFACKLDNLDFPRTAKQTFGIEAVE